MQMVKCPSCNEENPAKFRLCGYCGTPLAQATAALPPTELRKTVTLLFTDLKDSTVLGETLDSEAMHEVKERYFAAMSAEIERHGGKIEKYIGDAIMAVFGLPRAHEDDALRAVRAAVGMQKILVKLNKGLKARFGCELKNRTGVNTGEVVTTDDPTRDQKMATGDAVNVTARLEAAAPVNEILIGEVTYRLVRDAVQAEPVEPLTLKGKSEPVPAYKLISVYGEDGNVRRHDTPVVGREEELAALEEAWQEVNSERRARLVTVIGDAGVGKTRLVREIMDRLSARGARIVSGRCLPYGEGITFWPLRGMVLGAAAIHQDDTPEQAQEKILSCVRDRDVADRLASAIGLSSASFTVQDITWAARRFLQILTCEAPVVALFDDIHWAEPAFLDLMDNLLDSIENAPVLMLGTARHDLLESRPTWSDRPRARRLVLKPLGDAAVAQVIRNLLGSAGLPDSFIKRVVDAAEGNPLYVEQMLSMLVDTGVVRQVDGQWVASKPDGEISIPPTIHALLEARLDKLERGERAAAEPASVIGLEFMRPAVQSLASPAVRESIDEKLQALSRKHFIRSAVGTEGDARFRFDHHLVRETVYSGLLKRARATMHAEYVKWSDGFHAGSDRGREFEEILGYHLEQAYKYLGELGPIDDMGAAIGRDGGKRLSSAGRRAFSRGDMHAAANLLERAVALFQPDDVLRAELLPELGEIFLLLGDYLKARETVREARTVAERIGSPRIKAAGQLVELLIRMFARDKGGSSDEVLPAPSDLIPLLEREGANNELAIAWRLILLTHGVAGKYELAREAAENSVRHARLAGNERLATKIGANLADFALLGPTSVEQAIQTCEKLISDGLGDRQVECRVMCRLAQLRAMNGELDTARALYRQARATLQDLGHGAFVHRTGIDVALVELLGDDFAQAEPDVRADLDVLAKAGDTYYVSTIAALLARLVAGQGRDDEALELTEMAEAASAEDDLDSQALWRSTRAGILARSGKLPEAEEMARAAVEFVRQTEAPMLKADALSDLADVLQIAGKTEEAYRIIDEAMRLYAAKGNTVSAGRCKKMAEGLGRPSA
jgi:class 3 adenylate cyclase/tetratricopeptide (TPR) repeat protein